MTVMADFHSSVTTMSYYNPSPRLLPPGMSFLYIVKVTSQTKKQLLHIMIWHKLQAKTTSNPDRQQHVSKFKVQNTYCHEIIYLACCLLCVF
jgi:hypothetical protein